MISNQSYRTVPACIKVPADQYDEYMKMNRQYFNSNVGMFIFPSNTTSNINNTSSASYMVKNGNVIIPSSSCNPSQISYLQKNGYSPSTYNGQEIYNLNSRMISDLKEWGFKKRENLF